MLFLIENIQLKKIQEHILEILVTALLENIDLLLQFLMYITKINTIDPGQAYKCVWVKPTLTRTKSDPNDMDNSDGCYAGMYIHTCTRFLIAAML